MKNKEFRRPIAQFLDHHGVEYRFEPRAKHDAVKFQFNGNACVFVFPRTGSDWRGPANAITQLKRLMGLVNAANDNKDFKPQDRAKHRRSRSAVSRMPFMSTIEPPVVRADRWFSHLQIIRDRLVAASEKPTVTPSVNDNKEREALFSRQHTGERVRLITPWLGRRVRFTKI